MNFFICFFDSKNGGGGGGVVFKMLPLRIEFAELVHRVQLSNST